MGSAITTADDTASQNRRWLRGYNLMFSPKTVWRWRTCSPVGAKLSQCFGQVTTMGLKCLTVFCQLYLNRAERWTIGRSESMWEDSRCPGSDTPVSSGWPPCHHCLPVARLPTVRPEQNSRVLHPCCLSFKLTMTDSSADAPPHVNIGYMIKEEEIRWLSTVYGDKWLAMWKVSSVLCAETNSS